MTIFTKTDSEGKDVKEEVSKVVPFGLTLLHAPPCEERYISNCGWVPMEGGNFDRSKEKRNSSFGPLSFIRLSSSPLATTPSPTLLEQENTENRKRRRCNLPIILMAFLLCLTLGVILFFCHTRLVRSAYKEGIYHGWNAAIYRNDGLSQRLEEKVEIDPIKSYEKVEVPRSKTNQPAIFLHDFKKNVTAIVDISGRRCFLKALDPRTVVTPTKLIQLMVKMPFSYQTSRNTVRETFRVGNSLSQPEIQELGSFIITRHCLLHPTYMLIKLEAEMAKQKEKRCSGACSTVAPFITLKTLI